MNAILNHKIKNMKRKHINLLVSSVFFLVVIAGCDKKDNNTTPPADMYNISATMNGAQEAPNPITTTGTGTVTGTFNNTTNDLQYNVSWTGLTGTASVGHFHGPAATATTVASPVIYFNLVNTGTSGTATGTIKLTDTQKADLLAGKWYANIHTATNSGGEIRGMVTATK